MKPEIYYFCGFFSNEPNDILTFKSGSGLGITYLYINIPNSEFISNIFISWDFFLSLGLKLTEKIIIDFILRFTYPIVHIGNFEYIFWPRILVKPYYCLAFEYVF